MILLENLRFHIEEEGKGVDSEGNKVLHNNFGYIYNIFLVDYFVQDFSHFLLDTFSVGTVLLPLVGQLLSTEGSWQFT